MRSGLPDLARHLVIQHEDATRRRPSWRGALPAGLLLALGGCATAPSTGNLSTTEAAHRASEEKDWPAAAEFWNRAIVETGGSDAEHYLECARARWNLADEEGAQRLLDRGLERYPRDRELLLLRGQLLCSRGFHRAAERDFMSAVEVDPNDAEGWLMLSRAQLELDLPVRAARGLHRYIELAGADVDALFLLGRACAENGELEEALNSFRGSFDRGDADAERLVDAASLVTLGQFVEGCESQIPEARGWIERAIVLDPSNSEAHFVHGIILELDGKEREALDAYQQCVAIDPKHLRGYHRLARAYARMGEIASADATIDHAIRVNRAPSSRRWLEGLRTGWR